MDDSDKTEIHEDYINRLYFPIFWPFKLMGLGRFDIAGGRIVDKSLSSVLLSLFALVTVDICALFVTYKLAVKKDYLLVTEILILVIFVLYHNAVAFSVSFANRRSAALLLNDLIEVDNFFGNKETIFMRDVAGNTYYAICLVTSLTEVLVLLVLFVSVVADLYVYISGAILIFYLYTCYFDFAFFISLYMNITLRVRYLNVAIMKLANVKLEYLPHQFPFNTIFWRKKYDDLVDFHKKAGLEDFPKAFVMIFKQLRDLESCYRFLILVSLCCLVSGTFVTVQNMIKYATSDGDADILRVSALAGWCIQTWMFQMLVSQQTEMLHRQIIQTNLICTYIQLKPTYSDEIYNLTDAILRTLELRDPRMSIYGMFHFNPGLLLQLTSHIFIYITMQLQLAIAKIPDVAIVDVEQTTTNSLSTHYEHI